MILEFTIDDYFGQLLVERAMIAHNANQMDGLDDQVDSAQQAQRWFNVDAQY